MSLQLPRITVAFFASAIVLSAVARGIVTLDWRFTPNLLLFYTLRLRSFDFIALYAISYRIWSILC